MHTLVSTLSRPNRTLQLPNTISQSSKILPRPLPTSFIHPFIHSSIHSYLFVWLFFLLLLKPGHSKDSSLILKGPTSNLNYTCINMWHMGPPGLHCCISSSRPLSTLFMSLQCTHSTLHEARECRYGMCMRVWLHMCTQPCEAMLVLPITVIDLLNHCQV